MNWDSLILHYEIHIRLGFFFAVFVPMALWEMAAPRRALGISKRLRWINNLGMVFLNSLILRLLFPAAAAGMAALAAARGWGLLNYFELPFWLAAAVSVIAMDCVIYLQHVLVHHADPDYDVATGARFHPLEIILSMLIKFATIMVLGPPLVAVMIFEVLLNATAMLNHSNVKIPLATDRVLRWFLVTPDMHRVHHSVEDDEANSNFGFNLPWWDRLFGSYRDQPRGGHQGMVIGIHGYRDPRQVNRLPGMLLLPFAGKISGYCAINRRQWSRPEGEGDKRP